ncbi:MAG TPA: hypothetical protein VMT38_01685 [Terracidiphilus sp.]|nr:hypothetical protein [Terracidiphilus sp.]
MGVTIHYAGQLTEPSRLPLVLDFARGFAESHHWDFRLIGETASSRPRGFVLLPHPDCEPVEFEFGPRFKFENWVKTQFAGPRIHVEVLDFLRRIHPLIGRLGVRDEAEYWTTGNEDTLRWHMNRINEIIAEAVANDPNVRTQVRAPNGRIIDMIQ